MQEVTVKTNRTSLLKVIGNTPMVNILTAEFPSCDLRLKLESYNPGGSIKDRVALQIIEDAERKGDIEPGDELVEATSGNTGIGIAWIGQLKGYKVTIVTHDRISKEKLALLKYYGANVLIMPSDAPKNLIHNYVNVARKYSEIPGRYFCNQFYNESNTQAHYNSTAPELWSQMENIDAIVCGVGSGGTLMGIARYFREKGSTTKFIVADPVGSIYKSHVCGGDFNPSPCKIEGIGSNFIPGILKKEFIDDVMEISDEEAFSTCNLVRKNDSIDIGLSSGAIVAAAIKLLSKDMYKRVACISPDAGERYLSKFQSQNNQ
ncbi:cysteine synthase family protein [Prodigiosinella confusarubida]|uniref:Cysteine synthase B n=1 Tax=Serratia sp. (strain ATCC 39006) TaxID=104623 RepID=A0A2I5TA11_SERS3|nr:cysteine synthase family protein [Serratia sp. ATCC 39006]AUH01413.1 cysteine synthase family protein [Serratia sp. ATCC 39006]AUH05734.1 cysteine synthase family protein [Serratia sp. ATCC 39006]